MFSTIWKKITSPLYKKGTVNFGNGQIDALQNKLTKRVIIDLSNDTMNQLFKEKKSYDTFYNEDGYGMEGIK